MDHQQEKTKPVTVAPNQKESPYVDVSHFADEIRKALEPTLQQDSDLPFIAMGIYEYKSGILSWALEWRSNGARLPEIVAKSLASQLRKDQKVIMVSALIGLDPARVGTLDVLADKHHAAFVSVLRPLLEKFLAQDNETLPPRYQAIRIYPPMRPISAPELVTLQSQFSHQSTDSLVQLWQQLHSLQKCIETECHERNQS